MVFESKSCPRSETSTVNVVRADSGGQSSSLCELDDALLWSASAMYNGMRWRAKSHKVSSSLNSDV